MDGIRQRRVKFSGDASELKGRNTDVNLSGTNSDCKQRQHPE